MKAKFYVKSLTTGRGLHSEGKSPTIEVLKYHKRWFGENDKYSLFFNDKHIGEFDSRLEVIRAINKIKPYSKKNNI